MSKQRPVALTIAGSDSGGGAGVQADLRAFSYFGVFGTTALTAVTAQNPGEVIDIVPVPSRSVVSQLDAVFSAFAIPAVKTGMLFSAETISAVADYLRGVQVRNLVVDPVMVSTSGARLLAEDGVDVLLARLLPLATVITPNIPEAEILARRSLADPATIASAALELARRFDCTVMIKGGHDPAAPARDVVATADTCCVLTSPTVPDAASHGTGCSLSAAIAACLALGDDVPTAIRKAKAYVYGSLAEPADVGRGIRTMWPPRELPLHRVTRSSGTDSVSG